MRPVCDFASRCKTPKRRLTQSAPTTTPARASSHTVRVWLGSTWRNVRRPSLCGLLDNAGKWLLLVQSKQPSIVFWRPVSTFLTLVCLILWRRSGPVPFPCCFHGPQLDTSQPRMQQLLLYPPVTARSHSKRLRALSQSDCIQGAL